MGLISFWQKKTKENNVREKRIHEMILEWQITKVYIYLWSLLSAKVFSCDRQELFRPKQYGKEFPNCSASFCSAFTTAVVHFFLCQKCCYVDFLSASYKVIHVAMFTINKLTILFSVEGLLLFPKSCTWRIVIPSRG